MKSDFRWGMVSVYSVSHFIIDFSCAFLMFRSISRSPDWYLCILLYNFCAFAMQLPIGILADKLNRNFIFAAAGCLAVAAAYGISGLPIAAAVTAGLGNGMYHIGGGVDVLNISEKKSGALGVFVSPGALGIYFGRILGEGSEAAALPILLALAASAGLIIAVRMARRGKYVGNAGFSLRMSRDILGSGFHPRMLVAPGETGGATRVHQFHPRMLVAPGETGGATRVHQFHPQMLVAPLCLFIVVCLRSYVGLAQSFSWKGTGYWGIALVCAAVLGKTAGGFLSDRRGPLKASVFTLSGAALLFLFPQTPVAGVASVLLFNMTMPITLWIMAGVFPGAKGFSFGLLTFALFLGFLPVYLGVGEPPFLLFPALAAASLALMWAALHTIRNRSPRDASSV